MRDRKPEEARNRSATGTCAREGTQAQGWPEGDLGRPHSCTDTGTIPRQPGLSQGRTGARHTWESHQLLLVSRDFEASSSLFFP